MRVRTNTIAQALERAHKELLEDLLKLEEDAADLGQGPDRLLARLEETRAHVSEHFRLEEKGGYMDAVRKREPRLVPVIDQLANEHGELVQALDLLCARAKAAATAAESCQHELQRWIRRLHHHEERENDIVQTAYNDDVGAED
jgi:hypothetical protein